LSIYLPEEEAEFTREEQTESKMFGNLAGSLKGTLQQIEDLSEDEDS